MADSLTDKIADSFLRPVPKKIRLPFTYFLALRYLKPKRTFLSLITYKNDSVSSAAIDGSS
jgi:hypothetical protein